ETLCADDPITRTVSTSAVNYLDFEETEDNSVQLNALTDDIAGKSYSVFMWLNKESNIGSGDFNEVLVFQDSDVDNLSRFYIRDTERLALWDGTNDRLNSSVLSNDTWYFVGYTYDNATGETKLYLNGNVEDSGTLNMPLGDGWIATLGAKYNDNGLEDYLDGKMAEITIWDKVLTQEEVTSLMGAASAHDATNLVAAYGTHKNIADNLLRDLTDNGNNGLASHSSIFVTSHEAEITDYDASANYSFSWKKGGAEFDTDATGNIAVEEGTLQYSVTYGTPLFQKLDDFSLSYTNLIPTQPTGKTIASSTNVTFEVEEIPGASYQWYRREEGFDEINITGGLLNRDVYRAPDGTIYNATSTAGIYYTTDEGNTWVIRNTAHGLLIDDIKEIKIFDDNIYAVQINKAVSISKDGGNSFQTLFQVTPNASANLPQTVMKAEDGTIYIGALNGLHVSN
ncbi:MAG: LamG domain-containing protein, partial [Roseivirga sp.]|nr:LamG domain-containing protein [Roseivirga sp.]